MPSQQLEKGSPLNVFFAHKRRIICNTSSQFSITNSYFSLIKMKEAPEYLTITYKINVMCGQMLK